MSHEFVVKLLVELQLSEGWSEAIESDESLGCYEGMGITWHVNFSVKFLSILMSQQLASLKMSDTKKKEQGRSYSAFYVPILDVTLCHFSYILLFIRNESLSKTPTPG